MCVQDGDEFFSHFFSELGTCSTDFVCWIRPIRLALITSPRGVKPAFVLPHPPEFSSLYRPLDLVATTFCFSESKILFQKLLDAE